MSGTEFWEISGEMSWGRSPAALSSGALPAYSALRLNQPWLFL
ncbi:hypothetical protein [Leptolyngbya sp. FACHB-16]|nr:hypothetical protein [Leptolyngbya sp. FACHB-16]